MSGRAAVSAPVAGMAPMPWVKLVAIAAALYCMAVNFSFVFAILPPIGRALALSELHVALVVSPAALVFVIGNGLWGPLVDRLGRKQVILSAVAATAAAAALFGLIVQAGLDGLLQGVFLVALMSLCRIGMAAFAGGFFPASQAMVADITLPGQRVRSLAVIGTGFSLGMITGPAVASAFSGFGIVVPFFAVAGLAGAVALLVVLALPNTRARRPAAGAPRQKTGFGQLWPFLAVTILVFSSYGILLQVTGFRLQDAFGMAPDEAARNSGWVLMATAGGLMGTQILMARLHLTTRQSASAMWIGALLALAALAVLASVEAYLPVLLGMLLFGIGLGTAMPAALGLLTVVAEAAGDQGRVAGLSGGAQGLGVVIGPLLGAVTYQNDPHLPYLAGIVMVALAAAVALLAAPQRLKLR